MLNVECWTAIMDQLPMTTDRLYNTGLQLISPPPEETLRRLSKHTQSSPVLSNVKRKRSQQAATIPNDSAVEPQPLATPNPRFRKQPKHQPGTSSQDVPMESPTRSKSHPPESLSLYRSPTKPKRVVVQSPHAENPNADYILPVPYDAVSSEDPKQRRSVLSARSSRRSATPIPPYEPPTDIFTPPKEVFVTPITATIKVSKSSKRKGTTTSRKKKSTPPLVVVKLEMPEIDLTAPMPPPSPGDDPLLLSSSMDPSSTPTRPRTRLNSRTSLSEADVLPVADKSIDPAAPTRRTASPPVFTRLRFDDLPPSSPPGENSDQQPSPIFDDSADLDSILVHIPLFGDIPHDNGWSDSEGDELPIITQRADGDPEVMAQEGEGEYTGRFKEVLVKTKADPPSSATKGRMDEWGNPKSPFPLSLEKKPSLGLVQEEEQEENDEKEVQPMSVVEPEQEVNPFDFSSIQDPLPVMSVDDVDPQGQDSTDHDTIPLEDAEDGSPRPDSPIQEETTSEANVEQDSSVEDAFRLMGNEPTAKDDVEGVSSTENVLPDIMDDDHEGPRSPISEEQPATEQPEAECMDTIATVVSDEEDSSSSDADDPDIVKITSTDPRAAARAAAILKQHNYDCFTKVELKKRHSEALRRRSSSPFELHREVNLRNVSAAGIRKDRRRTVGDGMGVRGDAVFIPGSPVTTLPELLREAEAEVSMEHDGMNLMTTSVTASPNPFVARNAIGGENINLFKTPLPGRTGTGSPFPLGMTLTPKVPMTPGEMCYDPLSGERMWTKEEWKRLDACFTDERLEVGARLGVAGDDGLAGVDQVRTGDVVKRFVEWMGGDEAVEEYGPAWSMENLLKRARALRKKQRSGNVAPPTMLPPDSSMQMQSPASPFNFKFDRRSASIEVPDFTPIRQRPVPAKRQWTSVIPQEYSTPFPRQDVKPVPATLLAPRYSHLLEEAVKVSKDLPEVVQPENDVHESDTALEEPESEDSPTTLVEGSETVALTESPEPEPEEQTIGKRVRGLIFSYLPTLKKPTVAVTQKDLKRPKHPGLPLPPKEVLSKPRAPVVTPAREPIPKSIPPKELVQLHQAPPIEPPASKIPKLVPPKELVELHHVTPKATGEEKSKMKDVRLRRSSGASVKDLIRGFEDMQTQQVEADAAPRTKEVKRMKSVGEWRKGLNGPGTAKAGGSGKAVWKP